jgi:hypothetical protein
MNPIPKKCIECGREDLPWFSKKRCIYCAKKSYGMKSKNKENITPRMTPSTKEKKKLKQDVLSTYFKYHIDRCKRSENSGIIITSPTKANICHIFPKSNHPSVQANLDNCIYLTLDEHTMLDGYLFKHEFNKVEENMPKAWEIIKQRIRKIDGLIIERTSFYFAIRDYIDDRNF